MRLAGVALLAAAAADAASILDGAAQGGAYMLDLYRSELAQQGRAAPLLAAPAGAGNYTVRIPMRDGAELYTMIFFPPGWSGKGAAVYQQCPYKKEYYTAAIIPVWEYVLQLNVSVVLVLQETRSRYNSTGEFDWFRLSTPDAQDTFDYLTKQDWSNGVILPWGISAMGIKVFLTSPANYTIRAQAMWVASNSFRTPTMFRNGEVSTGLMGDIGPFLNLSIAQLAPVLSTHEAPSSWWDPAEFWDWGHVDWPTVQGTGWFDLFAQQHLDAFESMRRESAASVRDLHRLVVDPLGHCGLHGTPPPDFNYTALNITRGLQVMGPALLFGVFKDATGTVENAIALKKYAFLAAKVPRYIWYVLGSGGSTGVGHYLTGRNDWPDFTPTSFYPSADGGLFTAPQHEQAVSYEYDPAHPTPSCGGYQFHGALWGCGPADQTKIGPRPDVLSYAAEPLKAPLAITGRLKVKLRVASSANDTDFVAKLVDVWPNGTRMLIASGILTMRWKDAGKEAQLITPGAKYDIEIDLWSTSYIFAAGHAPGVDITSSDSPAYRPNTNTGAPLSAQSAHFLPMTGQANATATNSVFLGSGTYITLPVVKISDLPYLPPISPVSLLSQD